MDTLSDKQLIFRKRFFFICGIFMIVCGFLLLPILLLSIICFIIGIIEILSSRYCKKEIDRRHSSDSLSEKTYKKSKCANSDSKYEHNNFHVFIFDDYTKKQDGSKWLSKYTYDYVKIYRPDVSFKELFDYDSLNVLQEPQNKYDEKAIVLKFCENTVGYLYKGKLQDMANDYISKGYEVHAQIQKIENDDIFIKLFFCQPRSLLLEPIDPFTVKLVSNGNEEMQNNISCCSVSDNISVEMDYGKEKYLVVVDNIDIGYIPKNKQSYLSELEKKRYEFSGKITEINENEDTGKYSVKVEIQPQ